MPITLTPGYSFIQIVEKTFSFTNKLINLSFWITLNLAMPPGLSKRTLGMSRQVLGWLGMSGHTQPKVTDSYATSHWWKSPYRKYTIFINSFQEYWRLKNPAKCSILDVAAVLDPPLDCTMAFWAITCEAEFFLTLKRNCKIFYLRGLPAKSNDKVLWNIKKNFILSTFCSF